jgi:KUP system potassium uptake protein
MLNNLKHHHLLHERNVILHVETEQVPRVPELGNGFYRIVLH